MQAIAAVHYLNRIARFASELSAAVAEHAGTRQGSLPPEKAKAVRDQLWGQLKADFLALQKMVDGEAGEKSGGFGVN